MKGGITRGNRAARRARFRASVSAGKAFSNGTGNEGMNTFLIQESFPIAAKGLFVFVGEVVSGSVEAGMRFEVPEAGHKWPLRVESVERVISVHGAKVALIVRDSRDTCGYLPGLGVGYRTKLTKPS